MNRLTMNDDIKIVCWRLEALAEQFKGWTVTQYLNYLELQRVENEQFKAIFSKEGGK